MWFRSLSVAWSSTASRRRATLVVETRTRRASPRRGLHRDAERGAAGHCFGHVINTKVKQPTSDHALPLAAFVQSMTTGRPAERTRSSVVADRRCHEADRARRRAASLLVARGDHVQPDPGDRRAHGGVTTPPDYGALIISRRRVHHRRAVRRCSITISLPFARTSWIFRRGILLRAYNRCEPSALSRGPPRPAQARARPELEDVAVARPLARRHPVHRRGDSL